MQGVLASSCRSCSSKFPRTTDLQGGNLAISPLDGPAKWFQHLFTETRHSTHKSTALIPANGKMNIPKEFGTVMKLSGELTKRHGLITYSTIDMMRAPLLTSIHFGARDARSIPAATEFRTKLTETWLKKKPNAAKKQPAHDAAL